MSKKKLMGVALFTALVIASKKEQVKRSTKPSTVFFYDEVMEPAPDDRTPDDQGGGHTPV